ncbi:YetF domain-containing protein [Frigidibacter sp. MR17.14]|uniref:DUF421 domain-containing protein n=1 Tax=Frigidibacter sp. MR17.14 TaxID=3126509 RepID=UPI003013195A
MSRWPAAASDSVLNGSDLDPFDICAVGPVVEGAGGRITGWQDERLGLASRGPIPASASAPLHAREPRATGRVGAGGKHAARPARSPGMDQTIVPFDLHRMFLGDTTPLFALEILFRVVVIYGYTLLLVRWVGGRGVVQLSLVEFLLVIAIGSAVGDAVLYPDTPLLNALVVITVVVAINKALDLMILRHERAKRLIDGVPVALVEDGRILPEGLAARDIGTAEVISRLRLQGIRNLGEVEHLYIEGGGAFSTFRSKEARPGLPIVPPAEIRPLPRLTDPALAPGGLACCTRCGALSEAAEVLPDGACPQCDHGHWTLPRIGETGLHDAPKGDR